MVNAPNDNFTVGSISWAVPRGSYSKDPALIVGSRLYLHAEALAAVDPARRHHNSYTALPWVSVAGEHRVLTTANALERILQRHLVPMRLL